MLEGGSRGAAVVPGEPDKSLLIRAVNHADTLAMPPKEKLSQRDINDLIAWVKAGAVWPDSDKPKPATKKPVVKADAKSMQFTDEQKNFWAFQPMSRPRPPAVTLERWVQSPIDRFILSELETRGLQPAEIADKRTLIRRATFDLIGLPPTPDEVAEFLADDRTGCVRSRDRPAARIAATTASGGGGTGWMLLDTRDSNGLDENLAHAQCVSVSRLRRRRVQPRSAV